MKSAVTRYRFMQRIAQCPPSRHALAAAIAAMVFFCNGIAAAAAHQLAAHASRTWSTAVLSVARSHLAATSLPSAGLAIFAGGWGTCLLCLFELMRDAMVCEWGCVSGRRELR
jgi:hypothetical protein